MEITVHSTLPEFSGSAVLKTEAGRTIDDVISAFCFKKNIPDTKNYVLRNSYSSVLPTNKTLEECKVFDGDDLYLSKKDRPSSRFYLLTSACLVFLVGSIVITTVLFLRQTHGGLSYSTADQFGVTIDAGSSHSSIFLYKWPAAKVNGTGVPVQIFDDGTVPGLSSYEEEPAKAGSSIKPLLDSTAGHVPEGEITKTPAYLGATAGMRLVEASDKPASDAIMASTRETISASDFAFTDPTSQCQILPGQSEGAFSWITVNFVSGVFNEAITTRLSVIPKPATIGALDLGGASTQVTFVPQFGVSPSSPDQKSLLLYGHGYTVYTHSYLCYGANESYRKYQALLVKKQKFRGVINDPCRPKGNSQTVAYTDVFKAPCTGKKYEQIPAAMKDKSFTFVGMSDTARCQKAVAKIFDFESPCDSPPCAFNGVSMPPVYGKFMAFSSFYYPLRFLNLTDKDPFSLHKFERTFASFCQKEWSEVSQMPPKGGDLTVQCYQNVYVHTILLKGYKFTAATWSNLNFVKNINNTDLGWALGSMINSSNSIPARLSTPVLGDGLFVGLIIFFALLLGTAVGIAIQSRGRKESHLPYTKRVLMGDMS